MERIKEWINPGVVYTISGKATKKVTRIEVIDDEGRSYTNYNVDNHSLSYQDEGRTLKIFINK